MSELIFWNWDKKQRTMLRNIKAGDIFCFQYNADTYCFGRIISRLKNGTPAEIFDYVSNTPSISKEVLENVGRMFHPINLDIYALFDRRQMGDWRMIGKDKDFKPVNVENIFFAYGIGAPYKKIDVYGNTTIITKEEAKDMPHFGFLNDFHIKELVKSKINKEYTDPLESKIKKVKNSDIADKIAPFILSESIDSVSVLLNVGSYKNHLFQEQLQNGCGNGYDWSALAKIFMKERLPDVKDAIHFDPEADMFCAYSENKKALIKFAAAFHEMCENEDGMRELLSHVELD